MKSKKRPSSAPSAAQALLEGLVVASHGRHSVVEMPDGNRRICHPRGKKNQAVVGDAVLWLPAPPGQGEEGSIERVQPRRNLLYRQDEVRTKSFAANIDQVLILLAAEPVFSESQLARALIAAAEAGITPIIALNKSDLAAPFAQAWQRLEPYRAMHLVLGLQLSGLSGAQAQAQTQAQTERLRALLSGKTTLVLGPSGTGKSTLINSLVPQAQAATAEISQALNSGRHTTTSTTLYWLDEARRSALMDSPGFQEFGLHHILPAALAHYMPDVAALAAQGCKFHNCTHLHEPGCAVLANLQAPDQALETGQTGQLAASRHRLYAQLFEELSQYSLY